MCEKHLTLNYTDLSTYCIMYSFFAAENALPQSCVQTAEFLLFVDKLFDSVNGSASTSSETKPLRCAVTKKTPHIQFWYDAIKILDTVSFSNAKRKKYVPPTITNWILTLKGFIYIWKKLSAKGFISMIPRNMNQDSLENFFGCIRSHGVRNINPTCTNFTQYYKTLILNNFAAPHSISFNCEEDEGTAILTNLRHFIEIENDEVSTEAIEVEAPQNITFSASTDYILRLHTYLAGYVAKKILQRVHRCVTCSTDLISGETEHLLQFRQYVPGKLVAPNTRFAQLFTKSCEVMAHYLPQTYSESNIARRLQTILRQYIDIKFNCTKHDLLSLYLQFFVKFYLFTWCKNLNKILKGTETRVGDNPMKREARKIFLTHHKKKLAIDKIKFKK